MTLFRKSNADRSKNPLIKGGRRAFFARTKKRSISLSSQQKQLEAYYLEANKEVDDAYDTTASDGLDTNETFEEIN